MKYLYICLVGMFITVGCKGQSHEQNKKYIKSKGEFDVSLTEHFPTTLTSYPRRVINSKNVSKNSIGFMLYEYNVGELKIDSLQHVLKKTAIVKYSNNDPCLLIVNRFETLNTYENRETVKIEDSLKINQPCYNGLYPIPNFINYETPIKDKDIKLDGKFDIYVIEAESGNHWKEFNLLPNPQMPDGWKNGYSRGVAISKEKRDVIYWAIIW